MESCDLWLVEDHPVAITNTNTIKYKCTQLKLATVTVNFGEYHLLPRTNSEEANITNKQRAFLGTMDGDSVIDERCDHHWYLRLPLAHLYFWSCHFKIVRNIHTVSVAWNIFQRSVFEYLIVIDRHFEGQLRFAFAHSQEGASHSTSCLKFSLHTRLLFNASFLQVSQILKKDRSNLWLLLILALTFHLKSRSESKIKDSIWKRPPLDPYVWFSYEIQGLSPRLKMVFKTALPHELRTITNVINCLFPLFDFDTRSLIWRLKIKDGIQRVPPPLQFPGQAA